MADSTTTNYGLTKPEVSVSKLWGAKLNADMDLIDSQMKVNSDATALNTTHRTSDGKDHSDVVLNTTHRGSDGKDHSDVVLANTHRGLTNNPHSVTKTQVGLTNVTDNVQVIAPATNTADSIPQWNGANSKTLKDGLVAGTAANNLVQLNGSAQLPAVDGSLLINLPLQVVPYIKVSDTKAANTAGGTFTQAAWRTRDITTEDTDTGNNCTVTANQIILLAGTYECLISVPGFNCSYHKARLQNITAGVTTLLGTSEFNSNASSVQTSSLIRGRFTIAVTTTFEVQHYCAVTQATNGFGVASNFSVSEVYTIAEFHKVG